MCGSRVERSHPHPRGWSILWRMPTVEELDELDELAATFVTASRALVGIAIRSIEAAPVAVTVPQHRVLVKARPVEALLEPARAQ